MTIHETGMSKDGIAKTLIDESEGCPPASQADGCRTDLTSESTLSDSIQFLINVINQQCDFYAPDFSDRLMAIHDQFGGLEEVANLFEQAADAYCEEVLSRAVQALESIRERRSRINTAAGK